MVARQGVPRSTLFCLGIPCTVITPRVQIRDDVPSRTPNCFDLVIDAVLAMFSFVCGELAPLRVFATTTCVDSLFVVSVTSFPCAICCGRGLASNAVLLAVGRHASLLSQQHGRAQHGRAPKAKLKLLSGELILAYLWLS